MVFAVWAVRARRRTRRQPKRAFHQAKEYGLAHAGEIAQREAAGARPRPRLLPPLPRQHHPLRPRPAGTRGDAEVPRTGRASWARREACGERLAIRTSHPERLTPRALAGDEAMTTIDRILRKPLTAPASRPTRASSCSRCRDLHKLGRAAHAVTMRLHPEPYRTFNIDRNINYTNVCAAVCDFCAFYRKSGDADAYVLPREELYKKIEETIALGGDQILMQGGMHPSLKLEWYEELLRDLRGALPAGQPARLQPAGNLALPQAQQAAARDGAAAAQGRRARQPARRRRRNPRRPRPQGN